MSFYDNILASSFKAYNGNKNNPRLAAVMIVLLQQIVSLFLLIAIIKKIFVLDFSGFKGYKYFALLIFFIWWQLLYKYYPNDKLEQILENFEKKSLAQRRLWGWITIISLILPVVVVAFLLAK